MKTSKNAFLATVITGSLVGLTAAGAGGSYSMIFTGDVENTPVTLSSKDGQYDFHIDLNSKERVRAFFKRNPEALANLQADSLASGAPMPKSVTSIAISGSWTDPGSIAPSRPTCTLSVQLYPEKIATLVETRDGLGACLHRAEVEQAR
jgi:hypothetical protein